MMRIDVVTPFPTMLESFLRESILARAQEKGAVRIVVWNLRDFTTDRHKTVDDYPYGGGAGMILKPEPVFKAVDEIRKSDSSDTLRILLMSPQGLAFSQPMAEALSKENHLVLICGHYRGVDERIVQALVTDEISIGDYILSGGELAAAVVIDSVARLLPGVLGNADSAEGDSFSSGILDHPHYTRPEEFRGMRVPEVLLSGHHADIARWREQKAAEKTKHRRPDLFNRMDRRQPNMPESF